MGSVDQEADVTEAPATPAEAPSEAPAEAPAVEEVGPNQSTANNFGDVLGI